jgi:hypothetical protein
MMEESVILIGEARDIWAFLTRMDEFEIHEEGDE